MVLLRRILLLELINVEEVSNEDQYYFHHESFFYFEEKFNGKDSIEMLTFLHVLRLLMGEYDKNIRIEHFPQFL